MNLSGLVSLTDDLGDDFVVRSKKGLTGRITKNVCDAVSKALSTTHLPHLKFGDY